MSKPSQNRQDPKSDQPEHVEPMNATSGYVRVPRWVEQMHREGEITAAQRKIIYEVADETESWDRPWVHLTTRGLAKRTGLSVSWVSKCVKDLLNRTLLQRRERKQGQGYVYGLGDPNQPSREEIRELIGEQLDPEE